MNEETPFTPPWSEREWLSQVEGWIDARLTDLGLAPHGASEHIHTRPWSTVRRVTTDGGTLYFKASAPVFAHEPALVEVLARTHHNGIPRVLAIDESRGWMLTRDSGVTMRSIVDADSVHAHWTQILETAAEMQIALADHIPELLAAGTADRRLPALAAQYDALLDDLFVRGLDQPGRLTTCEYQQLHALTPWVEEQCTLLAASGIPESIQHEDFHDGNVLVSNGRYTFVDWGESSITHPFCMLLVTLRSIAYRHGLDLDGQEIGALRDAYLRRWTAYADHERLIEACQRANLLAMICRALTWHDLVRSLEPAIAAEHEVSVSGWLQEFLTCQQHPGI